MVKQMTAVDKFYEYLEELKTSSNGFNYGELGGRVQTSVNVKRDAVNLNLLDMERDFDAIVSLIASGADDEKLRWFLSFLGESSREAAVAALRSRKQTEEALHRILERKTGAKRQALANVIFAPRGDLADIYLDRIGEHYYGLLVSYEENRDRGAKRAALLEMMERNAS
jgi:hypothetical protein